MSADTAVETAPSAVLAAARAVHLVLEAAELRGLPMPFAAQAVDYKAEVVLQFHTRDEVVTWAETLEADVVDDVHTHSGGVNDIAEAHGEWLDVPIEVVCSVKRGRS